jgi:hypothetical protein
MYLAFHLQILINFLRIVKRVHRREESVIEEEERREKGEEEPSRSSRSDEVLTIQMMRLDIRKRARAALGIVCNFCFLKLRCQKPSKGCSVRKQNGVRSRDAAEFIDEEEAAFRLEGVPVSVYRSMCVQ